MIIIATIGRSGSSFLTKFLKECDLDVGSDVWFKTINAGLENKETLQINTELINLYVKGKKINEYYVWGDIHKLKYDVVKDPQFLTHTGIIKTWWKIRKDLKIIYLFRNPDDIVKSMKRVPEWNSPVFRLFPEMIKDKTLPFLKTVTDLKIPCKSFHYPFFLDEAEQVIKSLNQWIDLPDNALEIWNKIKK